MWEGPLCPDSSPHKGGSHIYPAATRLQCDERNLRPAIPPEWNPIRPDPGVNVKRTAGRFIIAVLVGANAFWQHQRADKRHSHLPAMGMPGQDQIEPAAETIGHLGIMKKQDFA